MRNTSSTAFLFWGQHKEPSIIVLPVLYTLIKYLHIIQFCCSLARYSSRICHFVFLYHLRCASCIISRHRPEPFILNICSTLCKCLGVRMHIPDHFCPSVCNKTVSDALVNLAYDVHFSLEQ